MINFRFLDFAAKKRKSPEPKPGGKNQKSPPPYGIGASLLILRRFNAKTFLWYFFYYICGDKKFTVFLQKVTLLDIMEQTGCGPGSGYLISRLLRWKALTVIQLS